MSKLMEKIDRYLNESNSKKFEEMLLIKYVRSGKRLNINGYNASLEPSGVEIKVPKYPDLVISTNTFEKGKTITISIYSQKVMRSFRDAGNWNAYSPIEYNIPFKINMKDKDKQLDYEEVFNEWAKVIKKEVDKIIKDINNISKKIYNEDEYLK